MTYQMDTAKRLDGIARKAQQLAQLTAELRRENDALKTQNTRLKTDLAQQTAAVAELQRQLEATMQRHSEGPGAHLLEPYIARMEQCIARLETLERTDAAPAPPTKANR